MNHIKESKVSDVTSSNNWSNGIQGATANNADESELSAPSAILTNGDKIPKWKSRYKTILCATFQKLGTCPYGDKCTFAHGPEDLKGNVSPQKILMDQQRHKTVLCVKYEKLGSCPLGTRCTFAHGNDELRPKPPSRYSCNFLHGDEGMCRILQGDSTKQANHGQLLVPGLDSMLSGLNGTTGLATMPNPALQAASNLALANAGLSYQPLHSLNFSPIETDPYRLIAGAYIQSLQGLTPQASVPNAASAVTANQFNYLTNPLSGAVANPLAGAVTGVTSPVSLPGPSGISSLTGLSNDNLASQYATFNFNQNEAKVDRQKRPLENANSSQSKKLKTDNNTIQMDTSAVVQLTSEVSRLAARVQSLEQTVRLQRSALQSRAMESMRKKPAGMSLDPALSN